MEPPLNDKEMVIMIMSTLKSPFYEHMLGSVSSNFVDIVIIGERIELGLKTGKIIQGPSTTQKTTGFNYGKKKEGEGQVASTTIHYPSTHNDGKSSSNPTQNQSSFQKK